MQTNDPRIVPERDTELVGCLTLQEVYNGSDHRRASRPPPQPVYGWWRGRGVAHDWFGTDLNPNTRSPYQWPAMQTIGELSAPPPAGKPWKYPE